MSDAFANSAQLQFDSVGIWFIQLKVKKPWYWAMNVIEFTQVKHNFVQNDTENIS